MAHDPVAWDEARGRLHVTEGSIGAMLREQAWEESMGMRALGYVGIEASRREERSGAQIAFRLADRRQRMLAGNHTPMPGGCSWWDRPSAAK